MVIQFKSKSLKGLLALLSLIVLSFMLFSIAHTKEPRKHSYTFMFNETELPCNKLLNKDVDPNLVKKYEQWNFNDNYLLTNEKLNSMLEKGCDNFLVKQKYFTNISQTEDEKDFPIAFTIVAFKTVSQVERLLRTIYRPWNYYCIHIDIKSDNQFFMSIDRLVKCLNSKYGNIINTPNRVNVQWGQMSVLTADLNCMREVYEKYKNWKYLINLTGQEFPLKTNAELVKILKAYKGANNLEGTYAKRNEERVPTIHMPFPVTWFKGSVHVTVNRDFVGFIFKSQKSQLILKALQKMSVPDEQFFSTLNHNPQFRIPGSFVGNPEEHTGNQNHLIHFITRYKNWGHLPCGSGKFVRAICILGVADLPTLVSTPHLFANKFYEDFQPATLGCMEKWYYDKVADQINKKTVEVDVKFYESLPFVIYRYIPPKLY